MGSSCVGYYSTYEGKTATDAIVTVSEWTMADTSKDVIPTVAYMRGDALLFPGFQMLTRKLLELA